MNFLRRVFKNESGQDLTEWAMLIALVVLSSAGFMYSGSNPVSTIWNSTNAALQGSLNNNSTPTQSPLLPSGGGSGTNDGGHDHHDGR